MVRCWRGLDTESLEILRSDETLQNVRSNIVALGDKPFALEHRWTLDSERRSLSVDLRLEERTLRIERAGEHDWSVDGVFRPDLAGAEEIDLSCTPFCNSLPLWRGITELDTVYVEFPAMNVFRSKQRYDWLGERQFRYVDLGASAGFEAVLDLDTEGFVKSYEGLFEATIKECSPKAKF